MYRINTHRLTCLVTGLVSIVGALAVAPVTMVHAARQPNVLFIAVDDLRPEMACYGMPQMVTPNFDRLAARGVRFDRPIATLPSVGPHEPAS